MQKGIVNIQRVDETEVRKESVITPLKNQLSESVIEVAQRSEFKMRGRYQILSMAPRPPWIPLAVWLQMRRTGKIDDKIIHRSPIIENLIMLDDDIGLNLIMQHISGDVTFPLEIDSLRIGTGTTPPASSDTNLQTPVLSGVVKAIGSLTAPGTYYSEWFITDGELANGSYNELGLFCGSQIFTRSLIDPAHVKAALTDTLIVYTITVSNV